MVVAFNINNYRISQKYLSLKFLKLEKAQWYEKRSGKFGYKKLFLNIFSFLFI